MGGGEKRIRKAGKGKEKTEDWAQKSEKGGAEKRASGKKRVKERRYNKKKEKAEGEKMLKEAEESGKEGAKARRGSKAR